MRQLNEMKRLIALFESTPTPEGAHYEDWPMLCDERHHSDWKPEFAQDARLAPDTLEETTHPVIAAFDATKVESLVIVGQWRDDHADCVAIRAVIAGTTYEWSDWWLSPEGVRLYARAECDSPEEAQVLRKRLQSLYDDHLKHASCEGV